MCKDFFSNTKIKYCFQFLSAIFSGELIALDIYILL